MNNKIGIYKIFWKNNKYFYLGQSIDIFKRFKKHINKLSKNIHENDKLQKIYNKYGTPELELLECCDISELDIKEQYYLNIFFEDKYNCNILLYVKSSRGYKHTEEAKIKIGEKSKIKVFTPEYREKLKNRPVNKSMLNKKHTEEAKNKMSLSRKGLKKSEEHKKKIGDAHRGNKHYNYGKNLKIETIEKIKSSTSGSKNHKSKKVINILDGKIFGTILEASLYYDINYSTLKNKIRKNKYHIKYLK